MKLEEILAKNITNGRFFAIEAETEKKRSGIVYRKRTKLIAQFGCNYENLAAVKEMGERESTRPSWFEHTQYKSIVRSKKDPTKLYLQIMNPAQFRTEYYLADGTPTTREELIAMGAMKDEPSEKPLTLVYALESIKNINYKEIAAA
ncbi:MAG: hypothetical protein HFE28_01115 [Clostridia bacterium]|jgi:hypothetical protein|nr:hypothetical protein [Clostridia bacterium]